MINELGLFMILLSALYVYVGWLKLGVLFDTIEPFIRENIYICLNKMGIYFLLKLLCNKYENPKKDVTNMQLKSILFKPNKRVEQFQTARTSHNGSHQNMSMRYLLVISLTQITHISYI